MAKDNEIQAKGGADASGAKSWSRRRMLKAAAAGAPLIATLPSGAAMANASASQCILDSFDDTHEQEAKGSRLQPDQYLREPIPVYFATDANNNTVSLWKIGGDYYTFDGAKVDPNDYTIPQEPRYTGLSMRIFVPYDDANNMIDSTCPTDVEAAVPGIWPANQLSDDSHMGLTGSCLCSINPDLA